MFYFPSLKMSFRGGMAVLAENTETAFRVNHKTFRHGKQGRYSIDNTRAVAFKRGASIWNEHNSYDVQTCYQTCVY